jgi:uncharacterized protein HemX
MSDNEGKAAEPVRPAQEVPRGASQDADWAQLAASLGASAQKPASRTASPRPAEARGSLAAPLALLLALIAIGVAGMLWWQYRSFYVSLDQTDTATGQALERVRAEQRSLQDAVDDVNEDVETLRQLNSSVNDRVDALPSRFVDLERRLDAVQGGSFDARDTLLRSEAEYYLTIANTELTLARNWDNAITALELADGRLAELANPELSPVREAIAEEVLALRSVRLPDIEGLLFSLGRLASRAEALPVRADLPANYPSAAAATDEAEPGLERLWLAIERTLLGLVHIERRDEPVATAEVDGARALLREMRMLEIDPKRPDISGSLNRLRALGTGGR